MTNWLNRPNIERVILDPEFDPDARLRDVAEWIADPAVCYVFEDDMSEVTYHDWKDQSFLEQIDHFESEREALERWADDNDLIYTEEQATELYLESLKDWPLAQLATAAQSSNMQDFDHDYTVWSDAMEKDHILYYEFSKEWTFDAEDHRSEIERIIREKAAQED